MADLTVDTLLSEVRDILQDQTTPYRYSDASLLNGLNMGLAELRTKRPDAFQSTLREADEVPTVAAGGTLPVNLQFVPGLMFYTAGWASLRDDSYSDDGRAASLMRRGVGTWLTIAA